MGGMNISPTGENLGFSPMMGMGAGAPNTGMSDKQAAQIISDYRHKADTANDAGAKANGHISEADMKAIVNNPNEDPQVREAFNKYLTDDAFAKQMNGSNSKGDTKDLYFSEIDQNLHKFANQTLGNNGGGAAGGAAAGGGIDSPKPSNAFERITQAAAQAAGGAGAAQGAGGAGGSQGAGGAPAGGGSQGAGGAGGSEGADGMMEKLMKMFMEMLQMMMMMKK